MLDPYQVEGNVYFRFPSSDLGGISLWVTKLIEMGNGPSLDRSAHLITAFRPRMVICCGIGGSLSDDLRLADVAISRSVADIIDAAKIADSKDTDELRTVQREFQPPTLLLEHCGNFPQISPDSFREWQSACEAKHQALGLGESPSPPRLSLSKFASGVVVASDNFKLTSRNREFKIVETEGAGVGRAASGFSPPVPFLVIRGVSDFADSGKKDLEGQSLGKWRRIAAHNAFRLLLTLLRDPPFQALLHQLTPGEPSGITRLPVPKVGAAAIRSLLENIYDEHRPDETNKQKGVSVNPLVEYQAKVWQGIGALQLHGRVDAEEKVLSVLLSYAEHFLLEGAEHPITRLGRAESMLEKIREYYGRRCGEMDAHMIGAHYHWVEGYLAHRKGALGKAVESMGKAATAARTCGDEAEALAAERCMHCMECELLSDRSKEICSAHLRAVGAIDKRIAALAKESKDMWGLLNVRFFNALVQAKACAFAGRVNERDFGRHVIQAKRILGSIEDCLKRGPLVVWRQREYDLRKALWQLYHAIYLWSVKREKKKATRERRESLVWIRREQVFDNCCLRLPSVQRQWLQLDA